MSHPPSPGTPASAWMSEQEFDDAVSAALTRIPDELARLLTNVVVVVEDEYEPQRWENPDTELFGLYEGVPLTERAEMPWQMPDRIVVFRGPLTRQFPFPRLALSSTPMLNVDPLALGVGIKALPALTSPSDLDDDEYGGSPRQAVYSGAKDPSSKQEKHHPHFRTSGQFNQSYSSSALHSIMEQGM